MSKSNLSANVAIHELVLVAPQERCNVCGGHVWITQHRHRSIWRLDGLWHLVMKDKRCLDHSCAGHSVIYRPPEELSLALKGDSLGLDVLFEIGELRLKDDRTFSQIYQVLLLRGLQICERTISNAYERFSALASCCNGESEECKDRLRRQGGIVVLVDGVQCDDHSSVLYVVSDAISHETLFAERHDARSAKALSALLKRVKAMGIPVLGVVSDKEKGLVPAIAAVFPEVPHQFCQLHFMKRCATALDKPLARLSEEIEKVGKKVRALRRTLAQTKSPETASGKAERAAAEEFLDSAHGASKVSGRGPFEPAALKRHERLLEVGIAVDRALKKKDPGNSSNKSPRS